MIEHHLRIEWNAFISSGASAFADGHYDRAEAMLRAAVKKIPEKVDSSNFLSVIAENLGEIFTKQFRYSKAERVYKRALLSYRNEFGVRDKNSVRIIYKLAALYVLQRRPHLASVWYKKGFALASATSNLAVDKHLEYMMIYITALHKMNYEEQAISAFEQKMLLEIEMSNIKHPALLRLEQIS